MCYNIWHNKATRCCQHPWRDQAMKELGMSDSTTSNLFPRPVQTTLTKVCPVCKQALPPEAYNRNKRDKSGLAWACRPCQRASQRKQFQKPHAKQRSWERAIERRYGITADEFNVKFAAQGYGCAVCGSDQHKGQNWNVDHDHETGVVRGILCRDCNHGIGALHDSPMLLRAAAEYLEQHGK